MLALAPVETPEEAWKTTVLLVGHKVGQDYSEFRTVAQANLRVPLQIIEKKLLSRKYYWDGPEKGLSPSQDAKGYESPGPEWARESEVASDLGKEDTDLII